MGRREQPLELDGSPVRELAQCLRNLRNQAGLTYEQLAARSNFSRATLQEALSGRRLPTLQVTLAIVQGCGEDTEAWRTYWGRVRRATDRDAPEGNGDPIVPPWLEAPPAEKTVGHAEGTAGTAQVHHDERSAPRERRRLLLVWGSLSAVLVTAAVATIVLVLNGSSSPSTTFPSPYHHPSTPPIASVARTYPEEEFTPNGAPTFLYLDGSGPGIPVAFGQYVRVSCKVYSTDVRTTWPDGYWYRLASMPWDNHYFAVANTFGNGDKLGKPPYTHNVDWRVPNCK